MNPNTESLTLNALSAAAKAKDDEYRLVAADADLKFVSEGILCRGRLIPIDPDAMTRLLDKIGAPAPYFAAHSRTLQAAALTEHAERGDFGPKPRLVMHGEQ